MRTQNFLKAGMIMGVAIATILSPMLSMAATAYVGVAPAMTIVDDSDPGFSGTGVWHVRYGPAFHQTFSYIAPNTDGKAAWNFQDLTPGTYDVYATWLAFPFNDTAVSFTAAPLSNWQSTFTVDETKNPRADMTAGMRPFQKIGSVTIQKDALQITVSGKSSKYRILDAVMIQKEASSFSSSVSSVSTSSSASSQTSSASSSSHVSSSASSLSHSSSSASSITSPDPIITITAAVDKLQSQSALTINPDQTVTFTGTMSNVQGSYGKDYTQKWLQDGVLSSVCSNSVTMTIIGWTYTPTFRLTCTPILSGIGHVTMEIDQRNVAYKSNTITITVQSISSSSSSVSSASSSSSLSSSSVSSSSFVSSSSVSRVLPAGAIVIDDSDPQFSRRYGTFAADLSDSHAYHGNYTVGVSNNSYIEGDWDFGQVPSGNYDVYATWPVIAGVSYSSVGYQIYEQGSYHQGFYPVFVDQTKLPSPGILVGSQQFQKITSVQFDASHFHDLGVNIAATMPSHTSFIYDAVMIVPSSPQSSSSLSSNSISSSSSSISSQVSSQSSSAESSQSSSVSSAISSSSEMSSQSSSVNTSSSSSSSLSSESSSQSSSSVSSVASSSSSSASMQPQSLTVSMTGPFGNTIMPTESNVDLGTLKFGTTQGSADLRLMYVGIEERHSDFSPVSDVASDVYNPVLRNIVTGQTVQTIAIGKYNGLEVYLADDFVVNNGDTFQILDSRKGGNNGDMVRADVVTESAAMRGVTDFTGPVQPPTAVYDLDARDVATTMAIQDVKPGGTINGNFRTIGVPQLNIAVQGIGTMDTAVKNQKDITLLRFQAQANNADVLLTHTIFKAEAGNLLNALNYALWVDTDGDGKVDTILQKGILPSGGWVNFQNLAGGGYVIPKDATVYFEVHADVSPSLVNNSLLLSFDTGSVVTYVNAENVSNGSPLIGIKTLNSFGTPSASNVCTNNCQIVVTMNRSKLWNLVSEGDLFVSRDTQPRSRQLLGGSVGDEILRLQFRAQNEDIDVTNLQFNSSGGLANSVDALLLYKAGETSPFATATTGGCGSDDVLTTNNGDPQHGTSAFCAAMQNQQLVVKEGQNQFISVVPRMKSDNQGAVSGDPIQIWMTKQAVVNNQLGSGAVRARGLQSGNNLIANNGNNTNEGEVFIGTDIAGPNSNIVGPLNQTVLAKITSITNANPDADNTNVPTGVYGFGQFTFTAAPNTNSAGGLNKATLSGVIFTVNATNVAINATSFNFYNKNNASAKTGCQALTTNGSLITGTASGSFLVMCNALHGNPNVDTRIPSGTSETFVLEGNITNPKVGTSTSTLQASLTSFTSLPVHSFGPSSSHIQWVDEDSLSSTYFDWIDYPNTTVNSTSYKS